MVQGAGIAGTLPGFGGAVRQESRVIRDAALVTPVMFDTLLGAGGATLYAGNDAVFVIKALAAVNPSGGAVNLALSVNGNVWVPSTAVAAGGLLDARLVGQAIAPGLNLTATGNGLRVYGWGLRVAGGWSI